MGEETKEGKRDLRHCGEKGDGGERGKERERKRIQPPLRGLGARTSSNEEEEKELGRTSPLQITSTRILSW